MTLRTVLATPWRTTHRSLRWLSLAIYAGLCVAALGCGMFVHDRHAWLFGTALYCFGVGYLWAFLMSSLLLVSIDAWQLRMPGIVRTVTLSLLLYGVLTVAVPVAMFVPMGGDAATVALMTALACTSGLAFVLLPRYLSMLIGFLPALGIGLRHLAHIPLPMQPGFIRWGSVALLVLVLVDIVRWRQLLVSDTARETGLASTLVMQFRRNGVTAGWSGMARQGDARLIRQRPDWMQARIRLGNAGPQAPGVALRVALGGWYAPQGISSHLRQVAPVVVPLLLFMPAMAIMQLGEGHGHAVGRMLLAMGVGVVGWLGVFGWVMLAALSGLLLWQRWRRVNAELPLLALLPGLGDAEVVRRELLRATLTRPLAVQALLLLLVLGAALLMHAGPGLLLFAALAQSGCAAALVAMVLGTFGGRPLPGWGIGMLLGMLVLLVGLSTFVPLFATQGRHPWPMSATFSVALAGVWIAVALGLAWLGRRGWQGLQRRPHPFLPN